MGGFKIFGESLAWGGMGNSKGSGSWLTWGLWASPDRVPPGWSWFPLDPCKEALDVLRGWSWEVRSRLLSWTWCPALKEGRPLEGGGSWLFCGPKELLCLGEEKPPVPPGLSAGRDKSLWRRRGCSMRGQLEEADLGVTEFRGITAGADVGLSLAFTPCKAQTPGQCRWVLMRGLGLLGFAGLDTSAITSSTELSAQKRVCSSGLPILRSLWPSVGGVFTGFPWRRCSLRKGLKRCSIWGWREERYKIHFNTRTGTHSEAKLVSSNTDLKKKTHSLFNPKGI